jgi:hypothetical protein
MRDAMLLKDCLYTGANYFRLARRPKIGHYSKENEDMGFHVGWSTALDQSITAASPQK